MSLSTSTMPQLVLVTGANGYIASSLIRTLLEQGYHVRGTVRDVSNESKIAVLKALPNASTHLDLVSLELTGAQDAFDNACRGAEWVFHTASPVILGMVKDEESIIEPALHGTLNMLRAANSTPTVRKFIYTSSISAICEGHGGTKHNFSEEDWTNLSGPHLNAYTKSKTLSERAAWDFMEVNTPSFTLTCLNPGIVVGPVSSSHVSGSIEFLIHILGGQRKSTVNLFMTLVDIRDVVKAHIQAAKIPEAAGKRIIVVQSDGGEMFLPDICTILKTEFGPMGYEISTRLAPKWLVWLLSWVKTDVAGIYHMLDNIYHFDNSRSRETLQLDYISVEQTLVDAGYSLIKHGLVEKKPGYKSRETSG